MQTLAKKPSQPWSGDRFTDSPAISSAPSVAAVSNTPATVSRQWAWHYNTLLNLRDRLLRAHADHSSQVACSPEMRGVDAADAAQEQIDRNLLWAELGAEDNRLFEVECALQRIRNGVYGICQETRRRIPAERLRSIPWTRYCRTVVEKQERNKPTK